MAAIPLLRANLVSIVLESFLYGIYFLLSFFALCLKVTSRRDSAGSPHRKLVSPILCGALLLFIFITAHWILNIVRLFLAVDADGTEAGSFYADLSHITETLKHGSLVATSICGYVFLIHHLWVVWAFRTQVIVLPVVTLLAALVFGVGLTYQLTIYGPDDSIFKAAYLRWTTGVCFFGTIIDIYVTGFIWYRLWTTGRDLRRLGVTSFSNKVIRIFIDSAALIGLWGSFHVITYQCGSNLQFIAIDCMPAMVGIGNLLIQIRLYWGLNNNVVDVTRSVSIQSTHQLRFATSSDSEGSQCPIDVEGGGKAGCTTLAGQDTC
ncbi:hypothetical protein B0H15DRAFT_386737 [Mycena belliarum]|uniref:Uncharacterized protein n=1 Tax=Mycena belliarum TaxID=1033014 RepID=A0AAD6U0H4_9AGAR|nr:hypothetical protein B0H15DRAFT_386737 [Mycena belliae]